MLGTNRVEAWTQLLAQPEHVDQFTGVTTVAVAISEEQTLFSVCDQFDAIVSESWASSAGAPRSYSSAVRSRCRWTPSLAQESAEARALRARYQRRFRRAHWVYQCQRCLNMAADLNGGRAVCCFWQQLKPKPAATTPISVQHQTDYFTQLLENPAVGWAGGYPTSNRHCRQTAQ